MDGFVGMFDRPKCDKFTRNICLLIWHCKRWNQSVFFQIFFFKLSWWHKFKHSYIYSYLELWLAILFWEICSDNTWGVVRKQKQNLFKGLFASTICCPNT